MRIVIVAVGSPRSPSLRDAIRDYEERAARYFRFRTREVAAAAVATERAAEGRRREGASLLRAVPKGLDLVALTRQGKPMSSAGLARYLGRLATYGHPGAAFLIGGASGLSSRVLEAARYRLSLSAMTLPHELARLLLAEQLYRAGTILRGEPYHRGP